MRIQESAQDYLEMILILTERNGAVRSIDISKELGYSKPSVSIAMKKLRENGYVRVDTDGKIVLEPSGYAIASQMLERHRMLTRLLLSVGISEETARKDACRIEHVLSNESYQCLKRYMNARSPFVPAAADCSPPSG